MNLFDANLQIRVVDKKNKNKINSLISPTRAFFKSLCYSFVFFFKIHSWSSGGRTSHKLSIFFELKSLALECAFLNIDLVWVLGRTTHAWDFKGFSSFSYRVMKTKHSNESSFFVLLFNLIQDNI